MRQGWMELEELMHPGKIRKRGCSSSVSSSSSLISNCRFKRAIVVGKRAGSATPIPTWRLISLGGGGTSTKRSGNQLVIRRAEYSPSSVSVKGKSKNHTNQQPVSARKLAATLWEANEIFSPDMKKEKMKESRSRDKDSITRSIRAGQLPHHLADPPHSPISEKMDRSGSGSHHKAFSSHFGKLRHGETGVGSLDTFSNACLKEIENRARARIPFRASGSVKSRLKDACNALATSKELLKLINRVWSSENSSVSSSMSLISALHGEVERARLQVNQLLQDHRSEQTELNNLVSSFAEERAAWKKREQKVVETAIESIAGELETEKRLRKRLESVNKQLGKELATTRSSLLKLEKELEDEKTARTVSEQVCKETAGVDSNVNSAKDGEFKEKNVYKKAKLRRVEKNTAMDKVVSRLEAFLGAKRSKDKGVGNFDIMNDEEDGSPVSHATCLNELNEDEADGEVENGANHLESTNDRDEHPIELNLDNNRWKHSSKPQKPIRCEEFIGRRNKSLPRPTSDMSNLDAQSDKLRFLTDKRCPVRHSAELERCASRTSYKDETRRNQSMEIRGYVPAFKMDTFNQLLHSRLGRPQTSKSSCSKAR